MAFAVSGHVARYTVNAIRGYSTNIGEKGIDGLLIPARLGWF